MDPAKHLKSSFQMDYIYIDNLENFTLPSAHFQCSLKQLFAAHFIFKKMMKHKYYSVILVSAFVSQPSLGSWKALAQVIYIFLSLSVCSVKLKQVTKRVFILLCPLDYYEIETAFKDI